ncbi:hypothetical protein BGZ61DRAFT_565910 [Ilyonectria robusta]|uniref:uncharacterized protein n=1 Tax=Ilyonectria robusta TaxID=1079257 RepID=UPI001E8CCC80|nr:uncharacterized protein BGZ61DRAFT_565910 [Ilyonectria robusta]KAH8733747.1 hypothetical protein BGZ61DRAFT_565910 [Ilyonectria robusta]
MSFSPDPSLLSGVSGKTAIVTGGANGIGLETIRQYHANGANVVIADLASSRKSAEDAIKSLGDESRALFVPVDIVVWDEVRALFALAIERFRLVDIVVANAGIMESRQFFDFDVNEKGELEDDALKHAVFHMKDNQPDASGWRGSVVLVASTSGYFGGTGVVSYVSSKHGVVGLLRSSHTAAQRLGIRVNSVAPFVTPTFITEAYLSAWKAEGLPTNTPADVAMGILHMSLDTNMKGKCCLVVSGVCREIEGPLADTAFSWTGEAMSDIFLKAQIFFQKLGGYPLPGKRS